MSSHMEIVRVYTGSEIDSNLISAVKSECNSLDLNSSASFKVFPPTENCLAIIESVKKQKQVLSRSLIVLLPGITTKYLQSPCIVIPITKDGLPTELTTTEEKTVTVNWDAGRAWEILQDVRLAPVDKTGGTLLLLVLKQTPA